MSKPHDVAAPPRRARIAVRAVAMALTWALCVLLLASTLALEPAAAELAAPQLSPEQRATTRQVAMGDTPYLDHDPDLGWAIRPHGRAAPFSADAQGIRDHAPIGPAGSPRILTIGDSFTHGDEVENHESFPARLHARCADTREVVNLGVPGYGPDQALLQLRRWLPRLGATDVVFSLLAMDLPRATNSYRIFLARHTILPFAKPWFELDPHLRLQPNPLADRSAYDALLADEAATLARLAALDPTERDRAAYWRPPSLRMLRRAVPPATVLRDLDGSIRPESRPAKLTTALVATMKAEVEAAGARFWLVLLPDRNDVAAVSAGRPPAMAPLLPALSATGAVLLDLHDVLQDEADAFRVVHYSPAANDRVAAALAPALCGG